MQCCTGITNYTIALLNPLLLPRKTKTSQYKLYIYIYIQIYPETNASPPRTGTTQACSLRDANAQFTTAGYTIFGLSPDAPAENTKFRTKQNLGYHLISDPGFHFHEKMGLKSAGPKAGGVRSVVVVEKAGRVVKEHKAVTPKAAVDVAKKAAGIDAAAAPAPVGKVLAVAEKSKKDDKKDEKKEKAAEEKKEDKKAEAAAAAAPVAPAPAAAAAPVAEASKPAAAPATTEAK